MATLFDKVRSALNGFQNAEKLAITPVQTTGVEIPPQSSVGAFSNAPVPPTRKASSYLREAYQSWTYAAVQAISREVASIELVLRKRQGKEIVDVEEHEALSLLHESNRFTTFYQLLEITQIYQELTGEAFWALLRRDNNPVGEILEIWPLRPDWFDVVEDKVDFVKGYLYKPPGFPQGIFFPRENIIHFKFPNPINPYRGKGSVEAAALAIDTDIFSAEWNRNFFFNSALPDVVFTTDQNISKETLDRLKEGWDQQYRGRTNAHKVGWLSAGFKPEKIGSNLKEADFLEQRRLVRDEILAVFGVPKSVVGVTEDVNRANAEASKAVFLENTIKPRMIRFVSHLNEFYLKQFKGTEDMFFDFEDPAPTDVEATLKIIDSGKDNWLTVNEAREAIGYDPIDGGDVIYKPLNILPTLGEGKVPNPFNQGGGEPQENMIRLEGKKSKARKKYVMPLPPKRVAEIRAKQEIEKAGVNTDFVKLMGFLMKNKTPKKFKEVKELKETPGNTPSGWTQEAKERLWEQKIARTDVQERVFKDKLLQLLAEQEERVLADLNNIRYYTTEAKKEHVNKQFDLASENKVFTGILMPFIREFMTDEGNFRLFQLGLNQPFDTATERAVSFLQNEGAAFIKDSNGINATTLDSLRKTLGEGLDAGESIPQLRSRVRSLYSNISRTRADMIARTEVSRAIGFGTNEAYRQSGIVKRKEWVTARDERVCPWCNSLDGKTISIESNFFSKGDSLTVSGRTLEFGLTDVPSQPLHPSCRCDLIPLVE